MHRARCRLSARQGNAHSSAIVTVSRGEFALHYSTIPGALVSTRDCHLFVKGFCLGFLNGIVCEVLRGRLQSAESTFMLFATEKSTCGS